MSCEDNLCRLLDERNMSNKEHYKNVLHISQRLKQQIHQLKMRNQQTPVRLEEDRIKFRHHPNTASHSKSLLSPTETLIPYYDNQKSLPLLKPSPDIYQYKSFDSAVELSTSSKQHPPPPPPPKLCITQTRKKYSTLFHHLQGVYQLEHILVYKSLVSPYMYASQDARTGEKKTVLKLIIHMTTPNELSLGFPVMKRKKKRKKDYEILLNDVEILRQLQLFVSHQPLLPLLVYASHIFRDGYKIYVVYPQ